MHTYKAEVNVTRIFGLLTCIYLLSYDLPSKRHREAHFNM